MSRLGLKHRAFQTVDYGSGLKTWFGIYSEPGLHVLRNASESLARPNGLKADGLRLGLVTRQTITPSHTTHTRLQSAELPTHSGYVFPDATSISPFLEERCVGPTSRFCSALAARLHCYVVAGYPERLSPVELEHAEITHGDGSGTNKEDKEDKKVGANAAVLYGPDGVFVGDYRKTNLYETDMSWARPGMCVSLYTTASTMRRVCTAVATLPCLE